MTLQGWQASGENAFTRSVGPTEDAAVQLHGVEAEGAAVTAPLVAAVAGGPWRHQVAGGASLWEGAGGVQQQGHNPWEVAFAASAQPAGVAVVAELRLAEVAFAAAALAAEAAAVAMQHLTAPSTRAPVSSTGIGLSLNCTRSAVPARRSARSTHPLGLAVVAAEMDRLLMTQPPLQCVVVVAAAAVIPGWLGCSSRRAGHIQWPAWLCRTEAAACCSMEVDQCRHRFRRRERAAGARLPRPVVAEASAAVVAL
mmetsp:Transcript_31697/g.52421  ORF Transcript_31697/g.52421 Transcript_31697/m.52421 type:complete len:254 (+) Transcript_31697:287-1048(+)